MPNREEPTMIERRNFSAAGMMIELRQNGDGGQSRTIGGYAVRYNTPTLITTRWC